MTEQEFDDLTDILLQAEADPDLNNWERHFIADIKAQADKWGTKVRISKKQWDILFRIRDK
jgi:hypothetical protein